MIDYTNFYKTIKRLELFFEQYQKQQDNDNDINLEMQKMSLVKAYELCYEALLKALQRYMREDLGVSEVPQGANPLFRKAKEMELFRAEITELLDYVKIRNASTHEYGEDRSDEVIAILKSFIDDAIGLYQTMTGKTWE